MFRSFATDMNVSAMRGPSFSSSKVICKDGIPQKTLPFLKCSHKRYHLNTASLRVKVTNY